MDDTSGSVECDKNDGVVASEDTSGVSAEETGVSDVIPVNESSLHASSSPSEPPVESEEVPSATDGGVTLTLKRPADDRVLESPNKRRKVSEVSDDGDTSEPRRKLRTASERRSVDSVSLSTRRLSSRSSHTEPVIEDSDSTVTSYGPATSRRRSSGASKILLKRQSSGDKPTTRQQVQQELRSGRRRMTHDLTPGLSQSEQMKSRRRTKSQDVALPRVNTTPPRHPARIVIKRGPYTCFVCCLLFIVEE